VSQPDPKPLLDYLDKEGTMMGFLSAFCVGAGLLMLDRTLGAKASESPYMASVWAAGSWYVAIAAASLFFGALMFYLQRSKLLWVLGRLAIELAKKGQVDKDTREEVEEWMFWWQYRLAWGAVLLAAIYVPVALVSPRWPPSSPGSVQLWMTLPVLGVAIIYALWIRMLWRRDQRQEPSTSPRPRRRGRSAFRG
jgi:hypothetical protein